MFTEVIETFVIDPIFHDSLHWNSPIVPLLFILLLFLPICYIVIKASYFGSDSAGYN